MATPSAKPKSDDQSATQQRDKNAPDSKDSPVRQELIQQHRDIRTLLANPEKAEVGKLLQELVAVWVPHTLIEEEILIPALEKAGAQGDPVIVEADIQRDIVKLLISELLRSPEAKQAAPLLAVLTSQINALIEIEERPENGVLALAATHGVDLEALRPEIDQRKAKIQTDTKGANSQALEPISLRLSGSTPSKEYSSMATSNYRERDEEGRFRSDDDRRSGYRDSNDRDRDEQGRFVSDDRGYSSRSRSDYDDDRRSGGRGGDRYRDDEGRFASDDRSRYARLERDYSDDDRRDYGRGEGRGWYGDPAGHSEASRRGWESREGTGYSSRSERDYDDRRHDRGGSNDRPRDDEGRFVSDDRYYSSRSSRDDDDRRYRGRDEGRGWHGDPQGHSAASRRGWEARESGGYSARSSRYEDDDDRRGGGRDHGGWFGDSRGHSEAARRGWEDRR